MSPGPGASGELGWKNVSNRAPVTGSGGTLLPPSSFWPISAPVGLNSARIGSNPPAGITWPAALVPPA